MQRCKVKIKNGSPALYIDDVFVGTISLQDYRNGTHGYIIRNTRGLDVFHQEAKAKYPDAENYFISYLDELIAKAKVQNKIVARW